MKLYLILIPIFILALLQGAFLPLNLVLLTILFYTAFKPDKSSLLTAFFGGLILDLAKGTPFGLSSLLFLVFSFILMLYSHRFEPTHWLFFPLFVFICSGIYSLVILQRFGWQEGLFLILFSLLVFLILKFFPVQRGRGLKLRV